MIVFRLGLSGGALNAQPCQIVTQSRQRTLVQEAGEIIGAIRHQLTAPNADEQREEFAFELRDIRRAAAAPSAACVTPSGQQSPRDLASRARRLASGARLSSADSSAYSRARAASISSTAPAPEIVPESAPTPPAARMARSRPGSRMAILEWLRLNGLFAE